MTNIFNTIMLILCFISHNAYSFVIDKKLPDAYLEKKAVELFKKVRCPVCAGESIYDSRSQLSQDMREMIRKKISNGQNEDEIILELKKFYGDQVIFMPDLQASTIFLWVMPLICFVIGLIIVIIKIRNNKKSI